MDPDLQGLAVGRELGLPVRRENFELAREPAGRVGGFALAVGRELAGRAGPLRFGHRSPSRT